MAIGYNPGVRIDPQPVFDPLVERQREAQAQEQQLRLRDLMQARQREEALRPALADFARGNKARLADIVGIDPELGMRLQEQERSQAEAAQKQARTRQTEFMRLFYGVQNPEDYAARRQVAAQMFAPDELDDLPEQFDPTVMRQLDAIADNMAVDDNGLNLTQRRGFETFKTNEGIRGEGFKQDRLDSREAFTQSQQNARTAASNDTSRGNALISASAMGPLRQLQAQKLLGELESKSREREGAAASFDTAMGTIDRLLKHKGMKSAVGWQAMFPTAPGTDAANFEAELDALKAQTFLPMVQSLRGMGALSNAEGEKLTNAIGALSTKQSEQAFKSSLGRIKSDLAKARARAGGKAAAPAAGAWSIERIN